MARLLACAVTAGVLAVLGAAPAASAYPGDLDPSFNATGYAITAFPSAWASAEDIAVQADGKLVAVGTSGTPPSRQFAVARYNPDGSLDTGFGSGGLVTTSVGAGESHAAAVAIQPDGKIVVGGRAVTNAGPHPNIVGFGLARYDADGSLDPSFGTGGLVTTYVGGGGEFCPGVQVSALALHAGQVYAGGGGPCARRGTYPYVARYGSNGVLDPAYGGGDGIASTDSFSNSVEGMIVTSDARAVVVGGSSGSDPGASTVVRFAPDGTLDTGFGSSGGFARIERLRAIAPAAGGRFVVVGTPDDNVNLRLSRYDADGTIDSSFGSGGTVNTPVPGVLSLQPAGLARDSEDRLVVASGAFVYDTVAFEAVPHVALHRWSADGVPDSHYGTKGRVLTPLADGALARGLAIQPDGRAVVAGCAPCHAGDPFSFAVARFLGGTGANRLPTASFTFTPPAPGQGETVIFDARASDDPDGPVVNYRWDLDGSGDYETNMGSNPYVSTSYSTPGTHTVGLEVRDADGATATTTRSVTVSGPPGPGPAPPADPPGDPPGNPPSPPPGDPPVVTPSVTINGGARYTNTPRVTLNVVPAPGATSFEASNDAAFRTRAALTVVPNGRYSWRLDSSGTERVPRTVRIRFAGISTVFSDTVILDQTAPRLLPPVLAASTAGRTNRSVLHTLRLTAWDRTSGIRGLQVTTNRRRPGALIRYRRVIRFRATSPSIYVRARDGAGNFSRWRKAAAP